MGRFAGRGGPGSAGGCCAGDRCQPLAGCCPSGCALSAARRGGQCRYKWLLGPFGRGYLWLAPKHRGGEPVEENWILRAGSEDFARLVDYRDEYQPGARRFDQGQRTMFELTPMAIAAMDQLLTWGIDSVAATLSSTTDQIADRLATLDLHPVPHPRGPHMLGVQLPTDARDRVVPALAGARCFAAFRGSSLRLAPHLHTTDDDVERLTAALAAALR